MRDTINSKLVAAAFSSVYYCSDGVVVVVGSNITTMVVKKKKKNEKKKINIRTECHCEGTFKVQNFVEYFGKPHTHTHRDINKDYLPRCRIFSLENYSELKIKELPHTNIVMSCCKDDTILLFFPQKNAVFV